MEIHDEAPPRRLQAATAACMGVFDGLHLGHRALLSAARALRPRIALVTFEPHPAELLQPDRAPQRLQGPIQRARVAEALGIDALVPLRFDRALAALGPEAFVAEVLLGALAPEAVVVGHDFRFGRDRAGDARLLEALLSAHGVPVLVIDDVVGPDGRRLSSTAIRAALERGRVDLAAELLGRWHTVAGTVVAGDRRGRTLGFPTANLGPSPSMVPRPGIYASWLAIWSPRWEGERVLPSVTSVGTNPTFDRPEPPALRVETHVLDVDLGDRLYGAEVEVALVAHLRDEQKFSGPEALVRAIEGDVARARRFHGDDSRARLFPRPGP